SVELPGDRVAARGLTAFDASNLGSEHVTRGDLTKAREYLERSWELLTENPHWWIESYAPMLVSRLATVRREDGDVDGTRAIVAEGLARYPEHTDLAFKLALCAREEQDWEEAERQARRCLELGDAPPAYSGTVGSGTHLAHALLGQLLALQGRPTEAEDCYRESLASNPDFASAAFALAQAMFRRGAGPA